VPRNYCFCTNSGNTKPRFNACCRTFFVALFVLVVMPRGIAASSPVRPGPAAGHACVNSERDAADGGPTPQPFPSLSPVPACIADRCSTEISISVFDNVFLCLPSLPRLCNYLPFQYINEGTSSTSSRSHIKPPHPPKRLTGQECSAVTALSPRSFLYSGANVSKERVL
jgi:hypothetical protein